VLLGFLKMTFFPKITLILALFTAKFKDVNPYFLKKGATPMPILLMLFYVKKRKLNHQNCFSNQQLWCCNTYFLHKTAKYMDCIPFFSSLYIKHHRLTQQNAYKGKPLLEKR